MSKPFPLEPEHKFNEENEHAIEVLEDTLRTPEPRKREVAIFHDADGNFVGIRDPIKMKAAGAIQYLRNQLVAVDERLNGRKALDYVKGRLAKIDFSLRVNEQLHTALHHLNVAVEEMLRLKDLKEKIDRGEATEQECQMYVREKETAWNRLRGARGRAQKVYEDAFGPKPTGAITGAKITGSPKEKEVKYGNDAPGT